jgi:uncharacterized FAD-dependent dehydrogenase
LRNPAYLDLLSRMKSRLSDAVPFKYNEQVFEINRDCDGSYVLVCANETIRARNIVLACGRSSESFVRRVFRSLDIPFSENSPDLGVRIEARCDTFSEAFLYQEDPKHKVRIPGLGGARTFCGVRGGEVVPVRYRGIRYTEGAFTARVTDLFNIALVARTELREDDIVVEEWMQTLQSRGRGLLLGEISPGRKSSQRIIGDICDCIRTWPSARHRMLMLKLLERILSREGGMFRNSCDTCTTVSIYGPAIDLYWPRPHLTLGFQTAIPGFHVIGDATGVSRGIVQALVSGAGWAISHRSTLCYNTTNELRKIQGHSAFRSSRLPACLSYV